jgi:hypothetical protein
MIARGKREARRPWLAPPPDVKGLKGRQKVLRPFRAASRFCVLIQGRRPDKVGTCPWLSYSAPSALQLDEDITSTGMLPKKGKHKKEASRPERPKYVLRPFSARGAARVVKSKEQDATGRC